MNETLTTITILFTGFSSFPVVMFLIARRDPAWDMSNFLNMLRVLSHLAKHPSDFGLFKYPDGRRPFWYIDKDEFRSIVKTRPEK